MQLNNQIRILYGITPHKVRTQALFVILNNYTIIRKLFDKFNSFSVPTNDVKAKIERLIIELKTIK